KLSVGDGALSCYFFGDSENTEENNGKSHSRKCGDLLGEQIDYAQSEKNDGDQSETKRNLDIAKLQIQRQAKFALARLFIPKHKHCQTLHGKAPHDTEGISFAQHKNVSSAQENRK